MIFYFQNISYLIIYKAKKFHWRPPFPFPMSKRVQTRLKTFKDVRRRLLRRGLFSSSFFTFRCVCDGRWNTKRRMASRNAVERIKVPFKYERNRRLALGRFSHTLKAGRKGKGKNMMFLFPCGLRWVCVCDCVCVCLWEREIECVCVCVCVWMSYVCVSVWACYFMCT